MNRLFAFLTLIGLLAAQGASAQTVDYGNSRLSFIVISDENEIVGTFPDWQAEISLPVHDLSRAAVLVEVGVASALTENPMVDAVLQSHDWLDGTHHPIARFASDVVEADDSEGFRIMGQLSIKGITRPVTLTITPDADQREAINHTRYIVEGVLDRFAYGIGSEFDTLLADRQVRITGHVALH